MSKVQNFGAKGDGVADDTAAIQHAVAQTDDGLLEFPRGDYRVSRTIEIKLAAHGRLGMTGFGGTGRITMAGPGPAFRFVGTHDKTADPKDFVPAVWHKERMPRLEGLEIVGAHPEADGVEFLRVMQPTLSGVLIREVRHAVRCTERDRN